MRHKFEQALKTYSDALRVRNEADKKLKQVTGELSLVESQLEVLARKGKRERENWNRKNTERKVILENIKTAGKQVVDLTTILNQRTKNLHRLGSPKKQVEFLNDAFPFLLFPVRLETRFMKISENNVLRVRIFPDDIAVDTHEEELTPDEIDSAKDYWVEAWRAGGDANLEKGAWKALVEGYDAPRAAWVAEQMVPVNWDERPRNPMDSDEVLDPDTVKFPENISLRSDSWTRAPRTSIMPNCFVIMCYSGDQLVKEVTGNLISDTLILGPDPSKNDNTFDQTSDGLSVDPEMEWMTDFGKAVEKGMAVDINLSPSEAEKGFDRVLALGIRITSNEIDGKNRLERLFLNHQYTEGLSIARQGDPTNNTGSSDSGFKSDELHDEEGFRGNLDSIIYDMDNETNEKDPFKKTDGQRLVEALGVNPAILKNISNFDSTDFLEAMAMNRALWPATIGYFMEEMMDPVFSETTIQQTRNYFSKYVAGRGGLPTIRVASQPYGILPTSGIKSWENLNKQKSFYSNEG